MPVYKVKLREKRLSFFAAIRTMLYCWSVSQNALWTAEILIEDTHTVLLGGRIVKKRNPPC